MREEITQSVLRLCAEQGAVPLLLCLTGSRAYGCHGPGSDYDVRFIYAYPAARYFSLTVPPDELRLPDGDVLGFELGKFLRIICKSGWNAHELLYAPTWHAHPVADELRALCAPMMSPAAMARGLMSGAHVYLRRLLYLPPGEAGTMRECKLCIGTLRMLLSARYVLQYERFYPLPLTELLPAVGSADQQELMAQLISCRALGKLPAPDLLATARSQAECLQQQLLAIPLPQVSLPPEAPMNVFYASVVKSL